MKHRAEIKPTGHEGDNELVFGDKIENHGKIYILPDYAGEIQHECEDVFSVQGLIEIIPETLAMETLQLDKHGTKIYGSIPVDGVMSKGGDEVKTPDEEFGTWQGVVEFADGLFTADGGNPLGNTADFEVIGRQEAE